MVWKSIHWLAVQTLRHKVHYEHTICTKRLYGRWARRNPAKVLLPFEATSDVTLKKEKVIDLGKDMEKSEKKVKEIEQPQHHKVAIETPLATPPVKQIKSKKQETLKKRKFYLSQSKVFDDNQEIIYEKLKEDDGWLSSLLVKLKSKRERSRTGLTLVEGWRLIVDGLIAKCSLNYVIFSRVEDLHKIRPFLPKTGVKFYKIPYENLKIWSNVETSPGIFGIFETPSTENIRVYKPIPLQLICDNIRDPGNLGAIMRAAVGVACEKILLSKGCVDVWDPKVLRSAAGAHFRLPVEHSIPWDEMPHHLVENTSLFIADSNTDVTSEEEESKLYDNIPVLPYYAVEFGSFKHITLIIGGETEGISEDSYRLAESKNGFRLNIPMQKGVDSLNTGMATAVIAFEIRKQYIQSLTKANRQMELAT